MESFVDKNIIDDVKENGIIEYGSFENFDFDDEE